MIRFCLLALIRAYQFVVSPYIGPCCRFLPTCSQYTYDAIRFYGPVKGSILGMKRLSRCHPYHPGGFDPLPGVPSQESMD